MRVVESLGFQFMRRALRRSIAGTTACGIALFLVAPTAPAANFCPAVWKAGTLPMNFNPTFMSVDTFERDGGGTQEDLVVNSFFNAQKDPTGTTVTGYFERDLVARIRDLANLDFNTFDPNTDVEILTDLDGPPDKINWPNGAPKAPDGMLPFQALVVSQGFHVAEPPGRLSIINLDEPGYPEYIVHQSTGTDAGGCVLGSEDNDPRFYHETLFIDMDADGLKDIVTARSTFKVTGAGSFCFFVGELVYFKNPGAALDPNTEWEEHVLFGLPYNPVGPDLSLDAHDFENDGVPEIVAAKFFGAGAGIRIFGAPSGQLWSAIDPGAGINARIGIVIGSDVAGLPFHVKIIDVNNDGKKDVLATNHQPDNCFDVTQDPIPGQVQVFEQPATGVFSGTWTMHVIKDNIRPNPTFPEPSAWPGRLAPGLAQPIWPMRVYRGWVKPWIVVGGDEASKVWLLVPKSRDPNNWEYLSSVIFDINDAYGPNASQTLLPNTDIAPGVSISTIGTPTIRYDSPSITARPQIYIPVFEGRAIHVLTLRPGAAADRVRCPPDGAPACPAP